MSRNVNSFIDSLLDAYKKIDIDEEEIFNEVNTFVNAGYETTSTALAWCLYCLARNTEAQEKLYKEICDFKKKKTNDTSSTSLQMMDFKEMPYLDLVIKESLRLHPPIPRFGRQVKDGTLLCGKEFPECSVIVDVLSILKYGKIQCPLFQNVLMKTINNGTKKITTTQETNLSLPNNNRSDEIHISISHSQLDQGIALDNVLR